MFFPVRSYFFLKQFRYVMACEKIFYSTCFIYLTLIIVLISIFCVYPLFYLYVTILHIVQLKIIYLTVEKENYFYFYDCVKKVFDCRTSVTDIIYLWYCGFHFTSHISLLFSLKDVNILFNFSTTCYKTFMVTQL